MILVIGDIHLTDIDKNWVKNKQVISFFDWLTNQDFMKEVTTIIFLGDLFEIPTPSAQLVSVYIKLFLQDWKNKKIVILTGNHDMNSEENSLDHFMFFDNVEVLKDAGEKELEGYKCLFLPHYNHEKTDKEPMWEKYSKIEGTWDYVFSHVMDETQNFGFDSKVCNLQKIKGKKLFGHIHSQNVLQGGNYLGSAVKNSSTEKDDIKYLALLKENKEITYIEVPSFMEYETVNYGEDVKTDESKYILLNILDAPSRIEALNYYETKYQNLKVNKVITKRQKMLDTQVISNETSEKDSWDLFCEEKQLSNSVKDICSRILF